MKLLSIIALVLFVSANSFAQTNAGTTTTGNTTGESMAAPSSDTAAPKMEKKSHGAKKKKHGKKHAEKAAE